MLFISPDVRPSAHTHPPTHPPTGRVIVVSARLLHRVAVEGAVWLATFKRTYE